MRLMAKKRRLGVAAAAAVAAAGLGAGCGGDGSPASPDAGAAVVDVSTLVTFHSVSGDEDIVDRFSSAPESPRAYVLHDGDVAPTLVEYGIDHHDGHFQLHVGGGRGYVAAGNDF